MSVDILTTLRTWGRASAGDLRRRLGVSPATLMRAARAAGDEILVRGSARRSTYAARRALRGNMAPIPVYRIDAAGSAHEQGWLHLTYPDGSVLDLAEPMEWPTVGAEMDDGWHDGLPYPLLDMRPQGFLGRNFARHNAAILQVDPDPLRWSDDDALHALTLLGDDSTGNFILGDVAYRRWLEGQRNPTDPIRDDEMPQRYAALAELALGQGVVGSSAGGEFPKFTALRQCAGEHEVRHVIVKFSGKDDSQGTRRWSDLLVCEHIAARVIEDGLHLRAAQGHIRQAAGRTFLEVVRFDRHGRRGRSGLLSLLAADAALVGSNGAPWTAAVRRLAALRVVHPDVEEQTALLWHFGRLIANTDMHEGNLSFQPAAAADAGLRLAPSYDMLPMLYAPARGVEVVARGFAPELPLPGEARVWQSAAAAALEFWRRASGDERISAGFRAVCADNARAVEAAMAHPAMAPAGR